MNDGHHWRIWKAYVLWSDAWQSHHRVEYCVLDEMLATLLGLPPWVMEVIDEVLLASPFDYSIRTNMNAAVVLHFLKVWETIFMHVRDCLATYSMV